ncbi:MAG: GNAT family N-acetyltransferase, partial [Bacteroidetes bacterium]|nr:GNAT family N-acetyltransferase [Bacteroidota bacterium]
MSSILDNPIWEALNSRQAHFNTGNRQVSYFDPQVSPFLSMQYWKKEDEAALLQYMPASRNFFILIAKPFSLPAEMEIVYTTPIYQMVCTRFKPGTQRPVDTIPLTKEHVPEMISLTQLTKPGPFTERTIEFGHYRGVQEDGKLAAMAGERLKVKGFTEVSAICTHPDHAGKGYAAYLLEEAVQRIMAAGDIPFLHVRADNENAIALYKKRGFEIRADIYFA